MRAKKNNSKKELSTSERRILDTIQQDIIEHYFSPALDSGEFEILSTLRYDPCFTHVFREQHQIDQTSQEQQRGIRENQNQRSENSQAKLTEIDTRLQSIDYNDNNLFSLTGTSGKFDEFIDSFDENSSNSGRDGDLSLLSLMNECLGTQSSSPPQSPPPISSDLLPIFYRRFLLLGEHFKRLNLSLEFFKWGSQIPIDLLLENLIRAIPDHHEVQDLQEKMRLLISERNCYKMRILISHSGKMRVEAHPLQLPPPTDYIFSATHYFMTNILGGFILNSPAAWDVFVDMEPTRISPFTTFKTTYRDQYNAARQRLTNMAARHDSSNKCEVLIYNDAFQLMEGSISSVAIVKYKEDDPTQFRFITPALASGCLCGTMRRYLLTKGLIDEHPIDVRDLKEGEEVLLLNGVMGCVKGTIIQAFQQNT